MGTFLLVSFVEPVCPILKWKRGQWGALFPSSACFAPGSVVQLEIQHPHPSRESGALRTLRRTKRVLWWLKKTRFASNVY